MGEDKVKTQPRPGPRRHLHAPWTRWCGGRHSTGSAGGGGSFGGVGSGGSFGGAGSSGSEGVEAAIKFARATTNRLLRLGVGGALKLDGFMVRMSVAISARPCPAA